MAHLGLTAAILPEPKAPAAERRPEKAAELLDTARSLYKQDKKEEARAVLDKALEADDTNMDAWGLYAELLTGAASVDEFTAFCERWSAAVPASFHPWNVLGRFYESQQMPAEALRAYRKSLEIEWNQPDVLQATERLEQAN